MFIRRKRMKGTIYYSVVESFRMRGRKYSRTIVSLGRFPTVAEAIADTIDALAVYEMTAQYPGTRRRFDNDDGTISLWPCGAGARERVRKLQRKLERFEAVAATHAARIDTTVPSARHDGHGKGRL